ncbi:hypothetical protein PCL_02609 [Purpureocillium lilacinum]|uniref:Tat pathway signal sequence n=1 Tax=Purpureocillium lilacinum TaxID=33203 RepID=A0A2U3DZK1_PURLI|nr:hypothetical protein PCL_02609 [Purpureocillium lilacinum]
MPSLKWASAAAARYSTVSDDESVATSEPEKLALLIAARRPNIKLWIFTVVQTVFVVALAVSLHIVASRKPSDLLCAKQLSPYSPFLETGDVEYTEFTDENGFLQESSPYEGQPSPELEKRWDDLWRLPNIRFPEEHMASLNKTPPEKFIHVAPQYGEGVLGFLNVFHQLHCLNFVRQFSYRKHYDYSHTNGFNQSEQFLRQHADHCIESLRKSLVCAADVTPMVYLPDENSKYGYDADFNMRRKCKNYTRVQQWARDHAAAPVQDL